MDRIEIELKTNSRQEIKQYLPGFVHLSMKRSNVGVDTMVQDKSFNDLGSIIKADGKQFLVYYV